MKNTFNNPLKTFNDNNALAIKKMGGAQVAFKKSLRKAQFGEETNDELINKPGSTGGYKAPMKKQYPWGAPVELNTPKSNYLNPSYAKDNIRIANEKMFNDTIKNYSTNPQTGKVNYTGPKSIPIDKQKKGGVIKSLPKAQPGISVGAPKSNTKMLEIINQDPSQYKRDRTPDVKKIYTDRNIPLTGPMSSSDSLRMADIETGIWNDTSGRKASTMAIGCKKMKSGGSTKALPKAQLGRILNNISTLKKIYTMYNTAKQSSKLGKLPAAKKVKKSGVTKLMSKSFNAIKNKKK
jgi:hypothetical protein